MITIKDINKGLVAFYKEKYNKPFPRKYNIENPYDVQQYIFDIADPICRRCERKGEWSESMTVYPEDNLEAIMDKLGYKDIIFTYKEIERLDFDGDWDKFHHIFSFKDEKNCANTPLTFISYFGCNTDPIDMIQFIYNTILIYESLFDWYDYYNK